MPGNIGTFQDGDEGERWLKTAVRTVAPKRPPFPSQSRTLAPRPENGRFFGQAEQAPGKNSYLLIFGSLHEKGRSQPLIPTVKQSTDQHLCTLVCQQSPAEQLYNATLLMGGDSRIPAR